MSASLQFHGLSVDAPVGWHNKSILMFTLPPQEELVDPRMLQKQSVHSQGNITVAKEEATSTNVAEMLASHLEKIGAGRAHTVLRPVTKTQDGADFLVRFDDHPAYCQQVSALCVSQNVFTIIATGVGTTLPQRVEEEAARLLVSMKA